MLHPQPFQHTHLERAPAATTRVSAPRTQHGVTTISLEVTQRPYSALKRFRQGLVKDA